MDEDEVHIESSLVKKSSIDKLIGLKYNKLCHAVVAELADALDSGSSARKGMEVQVLSTAPL